MRKEYTINELTEIFGCSRTAIVKKIKPDEKNPVIKRYKGVYDVVTSNGNIAILFDDEDLEHEKSLSRGFKNVANNPVNTVESDDIIDIEPERKETNLEMVLSLTERYKNEITTLQKDMYNELRQRDNQILLLTTSEKTKEEEYLRTQAENKALKLRNRVLTVLTSVIGIVLLVWITFYITYTTLNSNLNSSDIKKEQVQQENSVEHARNKNI